MSPLVLEALNSLTNRVNLATGLVHSNDQSSAKKIFIKLHNEGEVLSALEISAWAMDNGWQSNDPVELGKLAERIGEGGRVVIKNKGMWHEDIIAMLRARANNGET